MISFRASASSVESSMLPPKPRVSRVPLVLSRNGSRILADSALAAYGAESIATMQTTRRVPYGLEGQNRRRNFAPPPFTRSDRYGGRRSGRPARGSARVQRPLGYGEYAGSRHLLRPRRDPLLCRR